jgi:hypothetical protein
MRDQQRLACELQQELAGDARVVGAGVHWGVEVVSAPRQCKISCFWYGEAAGAMHGMNPGNARTALQLSRPTRTGAEYLVRFHEAEHRIAGGRTQDRAAVVGAVRGWLEGKPLGEVERAWPFVDRKRRTMRELLALLEPGCRDVARCEINRNVGYELWVYGRDRSCELKVGDGTAVSASFRLGPAQVAFGDVTTDPVTPISRWLHGATLSDLSTLGIAIERYAEVLARGDAARWHWLHLRDRLEDRDDVLANSRPLLLRLAERELPTRFFSYSSLARFCFSASSHYPWVDRELPVVSPSYAQHDYIVEVGTTRTECNVERAIDVIEAALAACPIVPFFGSAAHLVIDRMSAELAAAGTSLYAELRQRCQWSDAAVASGDRWCTVSEDLCAARFHGAREAGLHARFRSPADAVAAIRHWLEDRWTGDELRLLPSAVEVSVQRDLFDPD